MVGLHGRVIVTGGRNDSHLNTAWALHVGNGANFQQHPPPRWTALLDMGQERCRHGVAVGGGCVFVCSGEFYPNTDELDQDVISTDSCEMLRVGGEVEAWEALPPLPEMLDRIGCCYGGGNVFVVGDVPGNKMFVLNVGTRKWSRLSVRCSGSVVVCIGKRVMVLGGHRRSSFEGQAPHPNSAGCNESCQ